MNVDELAPRRARRETTLRDVRGQSVDPVAYCVSARFHIDPLAYGVDAPVQITRRPRAISATVQSFDPWHAISETIERAILPFVYAGVPVVLRSFLVIGGGSALCVLAGSPTITDDARRIEIRHHGDVIALLAKRGIRVDLQTMTLDPDPAADVPGFINAVNNNRRNRGRQEVTQ